MLKPDDNQIKHNSVDETGQAPRESGPKGAFFTSSWFSAGVSSAVATKLCIDIIDEIIYIHIDDHHPDTLRFVDDCEKWFGKPIRRVQSRYKNVNNALLGAGGKGYVNGPAGAACTRLLKRRTRREWEIDQKGPLRYVWGMDSTEQNRADRIASAMPDYDHLFPLIDDHITKEDAHQILNASGIKRPVMYDLGYQNNNCIGCVKGAMGYWNMIRRDFPDVFKSRAETERKIGGTCIKGIYLDELPVDAGRKYGPICEECGIFCEIMSI
jgi:3'-phosphoadenosine 5'-phosphosulfate sulfotransferase (PAPS reductase)/FAD synthetase